ncbi:Bacterial transcriptional activator domain protein, partial [Candidatus Magnetobacterium bavaricum]
KGDFIHGEQSETWSIHMRKRLNAKFISACLQVGEWFEKSNKWGNAIECYKKALSMYTSHEALYQRLMRCYQKTGQKAEGISTYNICREVLLSTFGVEPSTATKAIYTSILKDGR